MKGELNYEEIAQVMQSPVNTIKNTPAPGPRNCSSKALKKRNGLPCPKYLSEKSKGSTFYIPKNRRFFEYKKVIS